MQGFSMAFYGFPSQAPKFLSEIIARKAFPIDATFHSEALIDRLFAHYETLLPLQQWVYRMTQHTTESES
jgi:hypothetical protein